MPRYMLTLEYRGTAFHGFQKQPGLPTIQGSLEGALVSFTGREIRVQGAGRTDTGAHAFGQTAAFDLPFEVSGSRLLTSINALLPNGITATGVMQVPDGFDPRRDASWREYRYFILNRQVPSALLDEFTYHFPFDLDRDAASLACGALLGKHDFSAFRAKSQEESSVRSVLACDFREVFPDLICLKIRADAFLYRMVRILAGALVAVGTGKMSSGEFEGYVRDGAAKPCADPLPARGLFLWRVCYPPEAFGPDTAEP